MPGTSETLLVRAGCGDTEAFTALYDQTSSVVYGLALRVISDEQLASDVAAEAYLEVWRTAARFDPASGSALSWILEVTHRRAVHCTRSSPVAAPVSREHTPATLDALAPLPETQHRALALAYFDGHSCADVSRVMRESAETTAERLRTALVSLRQHHAPVITEPTA